MSMQQEVYVRELQEQMTKVIAALEAVVERIEVLEARADNAVVEGADVAVRNGKIRKAHR